MAANRLSKSKSRLAIVIATMVLIVAACSGQTSSQTTEGQRGTAAAPSGGGNAAGDPAPTVGFQTFAGETVTLASYLGRPVVLNFWASWCPSCVAEMSAAFRPVEADLGDEVTFIGMNLQDDRLRALALLEETGVDWIAAEDPDGKLYVELGGIAMPFTVYVAADGSIVDKHNGPLTERQLRDQIETAFE